MAIHHQYPTTKDNIWNGIKRLFDAGRLKTIQHVIDELIRNAERANRSYIRLKEMGKELLIPWTPHLERAGEIAYKYPRLSPYNNPRTKADTLVVAAAEYYDLTVVCNESRTGRRRTMHIACKELNIRCRLLSEFVEDHRLDRESR